MTGMADLQEKLDWVERLARGSVWGRFRYDPLRYTAAIAYWRLVYPLRKKGYPVLARTFFGAEMQVVLPAATEIFLFGAKTHDSEIRLARFLMKHLCPGDTFCDVGAHFGYFTLLASHLVGATGNVYAFEASRSTFDILQNNTAHTANVTALHRAAADEDKVLVFNEFPVLFSEYNSLVLPQKKHAGGGRSNRPRKCEVQGQRLDDFFAKTKGTLPAIVKIDVEGAEPQVLLGMEGLLRGTAPPLIVMEYITDDDQREAHRTAVSFARSFGYETFRITANGEMAGCEDIETAMMGEGLHSDNIVLKMGHR